MGKPIVALRPRHKEGSRKGLTLADVTVRRTIGHHTVRVPGAELAQLIAATAPVEDDRSLVDPAAIAEELDCLAELVQALGAADGGDLPLDKSLYWIGESLKRLGQRVMALEASGTRAPAAYAVEVTR